MPFIAEDAAERAANLLKVSDRLAALIEQETQLVVKRQPPLAGALGEERTQLANTYRLELGRLAQDRDLLKGAPAPLLSKLRKSTLRLQSALSKHEIELGAVKIVAEGLAQAMAEEVIRQRRGSANYGASGGVAPQSGPTPVALDHKA